MQKRNSSLSSWKVFIKQCLPRCCAKHSVDIRANILAVDIGLKPSFLFDYAFVSQDVMAQFIENIYKGDLICNHLDVISIDDHMIITKFQFLTAHLHDTCKGLEKKNVLIDVSKHLKKPEIMTDLDSRLLTNSCLESLNCAESIAGTRCWTVSLSSENNVTTLFGLLLGYPVVYWYSSENKDIGNCLEMVPMHIIKVFSVMNELETPASNSLTSETVTSRSMRCDHSAMIYSVSYPNSFRINCQKYISDWKQMLCSVASKHSNLTSLVFKDEVVTLPVVAM